jgi:hypothetical protein
MISSVLSLSATPVLALLFMLSTAFARDVDFESEVRPLLSQRCGSCHGPTVKKSGLRLDAKSFAFRGSDGGAVIVTGRSSESELIRRVTSSDPELRMPPEGDPLSSSEIQLLQQWIDEGACWPETEYDRNALKDPRLNHWAWQPVRDVDVPPQTAAMAVDKRDFTEIDLFVVAKLSQQGLMFSPEADRRRLIRRLSFDLLGLPPTPEEVQRFVEDRDPQAYERLIDRLLASPHYGERWARHWLDIAHYADTHGFERDQRRDNAWRYRDWVIRAINSDLPYDQFLRDQIAGDVLRPDDPEAVTATGFLAAGPWDFVGQAETPSPVLKRLARADDLDDMVTQVMTAACGVTINCARCHDHKLDPISQREYYSMTAVFAGVRRGDRVVSKTEVEELTNRRAMLEQQLKDARGELTKLRGDGWSLADIVGGGDGHGSGKAGLAIDPASGKATDAKRGGLENAVVNLFSRSDVRFVDGVVIPDGNDIGDVVISSTGLVAHGIPNTSGKTWDAIRNGPVNSHFSTTLGGIDFSSDGHSLLSLHANSAITFDLNELRQSGLPEQLQLRSSVGYFGQTPRAGASFHIFLDGILTSERRGLGRENGLVEIRIEIPATVRFLTLMATDHGNDISHDQICFADARLESQSAVQTESDIQQIAALEKRIATVQQQITGLPEPARIYAAITETPPPIHVMLRGNPEQLAEEVSPGAIACLSALSASFGDANMLEGQRRIALANWIASVENPLTRRVIVNRLWHHHFGAGLVDTPSDFGLGGSQPSHPELLDWMASRLLKENWSLKAMHRLICRSAAYRQSSLPAETNVNEKAWSIDSGNRLLWRQNARRLDAESLRDAVLAVSGKLNSAMFGPGYRDFEYKEEYAPVYTYITAEKPELWRRTVYRFVVRTTPDQFMATLDCPNAANLTPTRNITTTALQALALFNNEFILQQAGYFAERLEADTASSRESQILRAFQLTFGRDATAQETAAANKLVESRGLPELCRALLNANEFVYID